MTKQLQHFFVLSTNLGLKRIILSMIVLLSPAKTLDFTSSELTETSQPRFLEDTELLALRAKELSSNDLQKLMSISEKLGNENYKRYQEFNSKESLKNMKQALLAFKGDVYRGLEAWNFSNEQLAFAQNSVRILSGLYGLLRPLDLIQPYRLEMGTDLINLRGKNLYEFWGNKITNLLNEDLKATNTDYVINAASKEYTKAIKLDQLNVPVLEADFREVRDGKLRFITFNAKVARGKLAQLIVEHKIKNLDQLKDLDVNGYLFDEDRTTEKMIAFTKKVS